MERDRLLILLIVTLLIGIGLIMIVNSGAYQRTLDAAPESAFFLKRRSIQDVNGRHRHDQSSAYHYQNQEKWYFAHIHIYFSAFD